MRVAEEEADGEHDAGNRHRRRREERELAMAPDELAQAQVADDASTRIVPAVAAVAPRMNVLSERQLASG